ncbi:hypothetical protein [Desulfonema magnum]|uniref:Uncharacterized protein n=1 Tax=Desulfonema magnum TaxID=45655 RepID=A0A975BVU7_9BACT|nr:hypothetical protein [Desulfonema magnum]QTA92317.1 Uncharacterized protein dnm_083950 [Desulfonema magnum]
MRNKHAAKSFSISEDLRGFRNLAGLKYLSKNFLYIPSGSGLIAGVAPRICTDDMDDTDGKSFVMWESVC